MLEHDIVSFNEETKLNMNDEILVNIRFKEGIEQIALIQLSENLFKFNESSILNPEWQFGAIVEMQKKDDGDYELIRIVEKSKFKRFDWVFSEQYLASKDFDELKKLILKLNGTWEQIMNGFFIAYLPKHSESAFKNEIKSLKLNYKKVGLWESFWESLRNMIRLR